MASARVSLKNASAIVADKNAHRRLVVDSARLLVFQRVRIVATRIVQADNQPSARLVAHLAAADSRLRRRRLVARDDQLSKGVERRPQRFADVRRSLNIVQPAIVVLSECLQRARTRRICKQ